MGGDSFVFCDRVRFADLDARGHLNNVAFLQFVEAARIAFVREVHPGHDPTRPSDEDLILAHSSIDYRSPAAFEEEIRTEVVAAEVERRRFRLRFTMRSGRDGRVLAESENVVVGFDYARGEATDIAAPLYDGLRRRAQEG